MGFNCFGCLRPMDPTEADQRDVPPRKLSMPGTLVEGSSRSFVSSIASPRKAKPADESRRKLSLDDSAAVGLGAGGVLLWDASAAQMLASSWTALDGSSSRLPAGESLTTDVLTSGALENGPLGEFIATSTDPAEFRRRWGELLKRFPPVAEDKLEAAFIRRKGHVGKATKLVQRAHGVRAIVNGVRLHVKFEPVGNDSANDSVASAAC